MPNQNFRTKTSPLIVSFCEEEVTNILDAKRDAQNENKYVVTSLFMHTLSSSPFFFVRNSSIHVRHVVLLSRLFGVLVTRRDWLQRSLEEAN